MKSIYKLLFLVYNIYDRRGGISVLSVKNLSGDSIGESVAVLGFFDGVHKGHEALIGSARKKADELKLSLAVFTFSSLPTKRHSESRILTEAERDGVFSSLGVDLVYTVDFEAVRNMDGRDFVKNVLIDRADIAIAFCGENFRFGRGAKCAFDDLKREMQKAGRDAFSVPELSLQGEKISTGKIKEMIISGDITLANSLLSCGFFIENTVVHGLGLGKRLGFPTVNIEIADEKIKPKSGVYKSLAVCEGKEYKAITNIGKCPTFNERKIHAESFILDESVDLYEKNVRIFLQEFIREEIKFESAELLSEQIKKDIEKAR